MGAAIAANGRYVLQVGGFGSALQGSLVAVDPDAREIYRRDFQANIFNVGLSECGRFAAVQTAAAPNEDGNVLELHDLLERRRLFSAAPATGWADGYRFDVSAGGELVHLVVINDKLGEFRYAPDGQFLTGAAYQQARLERGDPYTRLMAVQEMFESDPGPVTAGTVLPVCDSLLLGGQLDHSWQASVQRLRGECLESMGRLDEALAAFDAALTLNPKVGVKRKADSLRKKLGKG